MNIKDLYSAKEEYQPLVTDRFNRFRSYLSGNGHKLEPILSKYLFSQGFRPVYKDGKKFAVCFSHDVDFIIESQNRLNALRSLVKSVKQRDSKKSKYHFKGYFNSQVNPEWSLDRVIDLEVKHNIHSSFYFLALEKNEQDFNYEIDFMSPYFKKIRDAGSEIGLHGGHQAFNDQLKIESEKLKLEKSCGETLKGYRNHYLRFKTPDTWKYLQALNFTYDTTFGYADLVGYRNGICYPFRPFNMDSNSYMSIVELPLVMMDVTFGNYMGLNPEESFFLVKKIIEDVKSINGVLTILWHNNWLDGNEGLLYNKIIDYLVKDNDAWFANSLELVTHWKENNMHQMEEILNANFNVSI